LCSFGQTFLQFPIEHASPFQKIEEKGCRRKYLGKRNGNRQKINKSKKRKSHRSITPTYKLFISYQNSSP
ncbi:MAG: hypothetical protein KAR31_13715, partial [Candidatus Omnitrophica bacterium]|nr:hypothetical protein [Candidatus Omnitrophota bacterium]